MTNGHPPQGGQPPPEGYPQQGQPQQGQPQQPQQWPQPQQPPPGGGYPQYPQQQGGYGQHPQGPYQYQSGPSGPRANFGQRLLALLLDLVIVFVPLVVIFALLGVFEDIGDAGSGRGPAFNPAEDFMYTLIGLAVTWSYYTFLEGGPSGQTIGKKALSIRVIRQDTGGPIGYGRALGRNAVRGLPGYIPFLGFIWVLLDNLWMLWDREKQTLHDKATKTLVVPVAAYPIQQDYSGQQSYGQPQQTYGQPQGYGPPPSTPPPPQPPPGGYNPNP